MSAGPDMPTRSPEKLTADAFRPFGSVFEPPGGPPLASDETFSFWSDLTSFAIDGEAEMGLCTVSAGDRPTVSWMERHMRTPEILLPQGRPFLLPVMESEGREVRIFRVAADQAVVIGTGVWHSVCLPAGSEDISYVVIFRRGTPHEDVEKIDIPTLVTGD